jgi:hypothetical protein
MLISIISNGSSMKTTVNNGYQQQFFTLESLLILLQKAEFHAPSYSKITYITIHI